MTTIFPGIILIGLLLAVFVLIAFKGQASGSGKPTSEGVILGGILGAFLRCVVLFTATGVDIGMSILTVPFVLLPTAAFGFIAGAAGGWMAHPRSGGLVGAVISGLFAEIILSPCLAFLAAFVSEEANAQLTASFFTTIAGMAAAGLVAGGAGGAISQHSSNQTPAPQKTHPAPPPDEKWNSL